MVIGICGLIGSGKNVAGTYLQEKYNFKAISFADSLKQAISVIFDWPFEMLKGETDESRAWREQIDPWWSKRLNIPELTPRWVLQQWGTELGRYSFHPDIWAISLEKKLNNSLDDFVITDCRFENEMKAIRNQSGFLIRINRGNLPPWYETARQELTYLEKFGYQTTFESKMAAIYPTIHISEWGWINQN